MSVTGVNPTTAGNATTNQLQSESLGKDDFLKLLVTQMQNQDPLNPMDSTEFTSQLAQFSSLEQMSNMNKQLEYLLMYQASINNSQAVDFIGKEVTAESDRFSVEEGAFADLSYTLKGDANHVTVNIYAEDGHLVKTLEDGPQDAGQHGIEWDGKDTNGNKVPNGTYTMEVKAVDGNGNDVAASTFVTGKVTGLTFENGTSYLLLGELEIAVGSVSKVAQAGLPE